MKPREFIRRLRRNGVEIIEGRGKGGHWLAVHEGRNATIPFHGDTDYSPNFFKQICKQLGLDPKKVF